MKFKKTAVCDECGCVINMPRARIEWGYAPGEMHLVHHECSYGYNNKNVKRLSDMILDQMFYDDPDFVFQRLMQIKDDSIDLKDAVDKMIGRIVNSSEN